MRIGQLARKLEVTPTQILKYLEELGIEADKGVNTKLMPSGIEMVEEKFGSIYKFEDDKKTTDGDIKPIEEEDDNAILTPAEDAPEKIEDVQQALEPNPEMNEESSSIVEDSTGEDEEDIEVIRPEYVKLQGLKVVDKIDLPEPKPKKEEVVVEVEIEEITTEKEEKPKEDSHIITEADIKADMNRHYKEQRQKERKPRKKQPQRKKRKPLTYEQKLEKERKAAERKKIEAEKKKKEKKRKAYEERLKQTQTVSPAKTQKKEKKKKQEPFHIKEKYKKEPQSLWGRFMKWLNT